MLSKDITVGADYAYNAYGADRGRHAARLDSSHLTRVRIVSAPANGRVLVKSRVLGQQTVNLTRILGTWSDHVDAIEARRKADDTSVQRQRHLDAKVRDLLDHKTAPRSVRSTYDTYLKFKVHDDGSYSGQTSRLWREQLVEVLQAAYDAGRRSAEQ